MRREVGGVYLIGVYLIGVYLVGVYLIGVYLIVACLCRMTIDHASIARRNST